MPIFKSRNNISNGILIDTLKEVNSNTLDKIEKFDNSGFIIDTSIYDEFGTATILTTWLVHDNYGFVNNCEMIDLAGYTAYWCENHLYFINLGLSEEAINVLIGSYSIFYHFDLLLTSKSSHASSMIE